MGVGAVVGTCVSSAVGSLVCVGVGAAVNSAVGSLVCVGVGAPVGSAVGACVGSALGAAVGADVRSSQMHFARVSCKDASNIRLNEIHEFREFMALTHRRHGLTRE